MKLKRINAYIHRNLRDLRGDGRSSEAIFGQFKLRLIADDCFHHDFHPRLLFRAKINRSIDVSRVKAGGLAPVWPLFTENENENGQRSIFLKNTALKNKEKFLVYV